MKKNKEIPAAGFCVLRKDLASKNTQVAVGNRWVSSTYPMKYRWLGEDEGFQIWAHNDWQDAESIDWDFPSSEKEIILAHFTDYNYHEAMSEIEEEWSVKDLKFFLKQCGYIKPYIKDIMIGMVKDLARIHRWEMKLEYANPFLVKEK